jgi:hypothetical protein
MRIFVSVQVIFLLLNISGCSGNKEISFKDKWDSVTFQPNPDKGWYQHLLDNGIERYKVKNDSVFKSFPGMDHLYLRLAWSFLEPEEGKYDWHYIDDVVNKYVPLGYKISFRISSKETGNYPLIVGQQANGVQYATPVWVHKAGAKGTVSEVWGTKSWVPEWSDPVYLAKLEKFQHAFAEKYDGKAWVRYIDVGSIGEWGEGHTFFSTKIPPTVEDVEANIDVYVRNFKKSQITCTDDLLYYGKPDSSVTKLYNYAISNGLTLRDDSPMVEWYINNNLKTWSVSHPHFYDPLYLSKPIVFELEHYMSVKSQGNWIGKNGKDTIKKFGYSGAEIMRHAIETMHATYIGFHGYAEEWLADNPDLTKELGNLCGYWYFPVNAVYNPKLVKEKNSVTIAWLNKGVAPAYKNYSIVLRFAALEKDQYFDVVLDDAGNKTWLPGIISEACYSFTLPENMPRGSYQMKFKLIETTDKTYAPVNLALKKMALDDESFVKIGDVKFK